MLTEPETKVTRQIKKFPGIAGEFHAQLIVFTLSRCFGLFLTSYAGLLVMLSLTNLLLNTSLRTVSLETTQSAI